MGGCGSVDAGGKPVRVVVLGAGYGGSQVARILDEKCGRQGLVQVTVIEAREFSTHCIAALRATADPRWSACVTMPLDRLLRNGGSMRSGTNVVDIEEEQQHVVLSTGETVEYDILVVATGSDNKFPAKPPVDVVRTEDFAQLVQRVNGTLRSEACRTVLVVGGGPVACELAGELAASDTPVRIVLVHSRERLINNAQPAMSQRFSDSVQTSLEALGVTVALNTRVDLDGLRQQAEARAAAHATDNDDTSVGGFCDLRDTPFTVELEGQEPVEADAAFICIGNNPPSRPLHNSTWWQRHMGTRSPTSLRVNQFLQLADSPRGNVFVLGDAASLEETALAYLAAEHAAVVAKNIKVTAESIVRSRGSDSAPAADQPVVSPDVLQPYKASEAATMFVPMGPNAGVAELFGSQLPGFLANAIKGKDLFSGKTWSSMNATAPNV